MSSRDNPVTVYLTDAEKRQVEQWADESGKTVSGMARDAILEYTDRDRAARIEDKVDRALSLLSDGEHTRTREVGRNTSVPEKARAIARRLYDNHEMPVKGDDVELAIEDIAGADERTIRTQKEQLKKRGLLYEHPIQPVWTDSKRQWVKWVQNATVNTDVHEWTDEYQLSSDEFTEIAEEIEA